MLLICSLHPPSFMRTAIGRRPLGSASKPELDDGQSCSDPRRFEPEFDERRRLLGIIHIGINRIRVPRKGEQSRSVHGDDLRLPPDMLETGVGDVAACYLSRREWPVQPHSEPFAEFGWIGERTPDTLDGCTQFDNFFDAIDHNGNLLVAYKWHRRAIYATKGLPLSLQFHVEPRYLRIDLCQRSHRLHRRAQGHGV